MRKNEILLVETKLDNLIVKLEKTSLHWKMVLIRNNKEICNKAFPAEEELFKEYHHFVQFYLHYGKVLLIEKEKEVKKDIIEEENILIPEKQQIYSVKVDEIPKKEKINFIEPLIPIGGINFKAFLEQLKIKYFSIALRKASGSAIIAARYLNVSQAVVYNYRKHRAHVDNMYFAKQPEIENAYLPETGFHWEGYVRMVKKNYIIKALELSDYNQIKASQLLKYSHYNLTLMCSKLGINVKELRNNSK